MTICRSEGSARAWIAALAATAISGALLASRADGQSSTDSDIRSAAAQALFDEGRRLLQEERFDEACPKLAESQRLEPAAGTLLNLALCYERAAKPATAWLRYNDALVLAARSGQRERQEIARARIETLEPQLSRLVFVTTDHSEDLWLSLDGVRLEAGALDTGVPVDPGTHDLKVGAAGKQTVTMSINVEGDARRIEVPLPALEAVPPDPTVRPSTTQVTDRRSTRSDLLVVLQGAALGIGASGLIIGGVFGVQAMNEWDDRNEHCRTGCDARAVAYGESAQRSATIATIATSVGLVALGAGIYLLLTDEPAEASPTAKLHVSAGADHAWVGASSRF